MSSYATDYEHYHMKHTRIVTTAESNNNLYVTSWTISMMCSYFI